MKSRRRAAAGFDEIFLVPHAHLDLSWLGTPAECEKINNEIIKSALDLLKSGSEYRYSIEVVRPLESFLAAFPEEEGIVESFISEGRLEIGGTYVDVACDYCFDESLARNLYFGQGWLEGTFGFGTRIVREEDVLSHFAQTPQLLEKSGISYFKISRGPAGVFRWLAPDGSEVVAALFEYSHSFHFKLGRSPELTFRNLPGYLRWIRTQIKQPLSSLMLMDGDDCTPPNPNLVGIANAWNGRAVKPRIRLSTVQDFLEAVERDDLPTRRGDMPGMWGGVLLFEPEAARKLQRAEPLITAAEKFAAASSLCEDSEPPALDEPWRLLLAAQDHNWGGKDETKHGLQADLDKIGMLDSVIEKSEQALDSSLKSIAIKIRRSREAAPIVVFNPLSWERDDVAEIELPFGNGGAGFKLFEAGGAEVPVQFSPGREKPGCVTAVFPARKVPPLGYRTFYLETSEGDGRAERQETASASRLENEYYRIELNRKRTGIRRIFDKEISADIAGWKPGSLLEFAGVDIPFPSLFALGARLTVPPQEYYENSENLKKGGSGEGVKFLWKIRLPSRFRHENITKFSGPVRSGLVIRGNFMKCPVSHEVVLYNGLKRIDITTSIEWRGEAGVILAMLFPLPFKSDEIHVNTPFYVHRMGDEAEGFWKTPGFPVQPKLRGVQNWFSAGDGKRTVTFSSPWRVWDFTFLPMAPILASDDRGGFFTGDHYLQKGTHRYSFSLFSHGGGWKEAMSYRRGIEPIYPLVPFAAGEGGGAGEFPEAQSFCKISPGNVIVTALKPAGGGDGALFVRFYEVEGKETDVRIEFPFEVERAVATDLLEREKEELRSESGGVFCRLEPHEIGNVKIFFKGGPKWKSPRKG